LRLSRAFLPTLKETPAEATIASHRLMLRAGLVRQTSAGIYAWLPLGWRVLQKIEQIVREEQDRAGAQEILMPTIQSAELWRQSGRYDAYGPEMLRLKDRHDREMLFGPTNEEMVTDIFRSFAKSYRDLPRNLYHIQWKFRDEVRPRFGVMRGREFLMKDAYSFDVTKEGAQHSYRQMLLAYLRTFQRMGLKAVPMRADTGPIGGNLSHEFIVLAETGESAVFYDSDYENFDLAGSDLSYDNVEDLSAFFNQVTSMYAATDEMHDEKAWSAVPEMRRRQGRGIEVGHIFFFGTKYSEKMGLSVQGSDGKPVVPEMGSYGIGISRLVGATIEANHDEAGIKWPDAVAPFRAVVINLKQGDAACDALSERLYAAIPDALYDDRTERAGPKFADADLMGHPWQVVIGPRGVAAGVVELKRRATGEKQEVSPEDALTKILG